MSNSYANWHIFSLVRNWLVNPTEKGGNPEAHGKNMPRSVGKNETGIQKRTVRTSSKSTSSFRHQFTKNSSDYDGYGMTQSITAETTIISSSPLLLPSVSIVVVATTTTKPPPASPNPIAEKNILLRHATCIDTRQHFLLKQHEQHERRRR